MNINHVRKVASKVKSNFFKKASRQTSGLKKSRYKASGLKFKEHQVYNHGDEVRFIDWKILAKTSVPYIKTFEEERNLEILVVVDASRSMLLGIDGVSKLQAALEMACLIYFLAEDTRDEIEVLVLGEKSILIPRSCGEVGVSRLISSLKKHGIVSEEGKVLTGGDGHPTLEDKARSLSTSLGKRKEVLILSDFLEFLSEEMLKRVLSRKNVTGFRLLSPLDQYLTGANAIFSASHKKPSILERFQKVGSRKEKAIQGILGGKVKDLKIEEPYLDDFAKEMM